LAFAAAVQTALTALTGLALAGLALTCALTHAGAFTHAATLTAGVALLVLLHGLLPGGVARLLLLGLAARAVHVIVFRAHRRSSVVLVSFRLKQTGKLSSRGLVPEGRQCRLSDITF